MRYLRLVVLASIAAWPVSSQTYTISTFAGGALPAGIPGTSAFLEAPQFIAADQAGNVFFVFQNSVLRLDAVTGVLTVAAGNGINGFSGDNGPAVNAELSSPEGLAVDRVGNLYIADTGNARVRMVSGGVITTVAGTGLSGYTGNTGPATSAQIDPLAVAVDAAGNLYLSDQSNRVLMVSGGIIVTIAGNGTQGFSGDNGLAVNAQLNYPSGVAVDSAGNLYIADNLNSRIRRVASAAPPTYAQFTAAVASIRAGAGTVYGLFNSLAGSAFTVATLYQNLLNRQPTASETSSAHAAGLATWFETLIGYPGATTPAASPNNEFQSTGTYALSADHTNALYVQMLYYAILGRDPDAGGLAFWLGIAKSGGPGLLFQGPAGYAARLQILGPGTPNPGLIGSPEFQGLYQ
jgi:hypothetical protein